MLSAQDAGRLLAKAVVVEEKVDGANAVVWLEGDRLECAIRGGAESMDRAGQLGPIRAWVAERNDQFHQLLERGCALVRRMVLSHAHHRVRPAARIPHRTRPSVAERRVRFNKRAQPAVRFVGVPVPPELWCGTPGDVGAIEALIGPSRYGPGLAEGVVVRTVDGTEPRIAKLLRAGYEPLGDSAWRAQAPPQPSGRPGGVMALSNRDRVGRAFELLAAGLGPYVDRRMRTVSPSGADWLVSFAASARPPMQGTPSLEDPALQLRVLADSGCRVSGGADPQRPQPRVRAARRPQPYGRTTIRSPSTTPTERSTRSNASYRGRRGEAEEAGRAKDELMRTKYEAQARRATPKTGALLTEPIAGLKPWREVIQPHDDVARRQVPARRVCCGPVAGRSRRGAGRVPRPGRVLRADVPHRRTELSSSAKQSSGSRRGGATRSSTSRRTSGAARPTR